MRTIKNRTATALGVLALAGSSVTGIALSDSAQAADRNGKCEKGEFCYNYNSNLKGSWSDFKKSVGDYGTTQPGCYEYKSKGNGKNKCIKNDAGGFWNRSGKTVTVYYNSNHGGKSVKIKNGDKGKLPASVYNDNASHRIGGGGGGDNPPGDSKHMSNALYVGGGGTLTCKFDGYTNQNGRHEGIDFAKGYGKNVKSLVSGEVVRSSRKGTNDWDGLGTLAIYVPKAKKTVIYLHANPKVKVGKKVSRGDVIATEAANGAGSATHTHVEMRPGKQTHASKSVDDQVLDNPDPTKFWHSQGYVQK